MSNSRSIVLIATSRFDEARRDEALAVICGIAPQVHAEPGCELYAVHTASKDKIVIIEQWADKESLEAHATGVPFAQMTEQLAGLVVGESVVQALRPAAAGSASQGALRG